MSLVPKTIEEKGKTLTLTDVQWTSAYQTEADGAVQRYSAAASYTGSSSYKVATGYTVTADYTGEVAKTGCDMVTYTAIFGSMELPEETPEATPSPSPDTQAVSVLSTLKLPLAIGGAVILLGVGGFFLWKKRKGK